jgi:pSer/pThr/pTyr-binding forkhead associated (FHA) protein/S1-C subfamily serine protease
VLLVLSGARAGHRCQLTADFATLGRHPTSDLPFDPERDTDVSTRHAAVFRQGPGYVVRDLGSTNGTWVNGIRVRGDQALEPGDRIRLGARGPEIEFAVEEVEERPMVRAPLVESDPPQEIMTASDPPARRAVIGQEQSTTDLKIRVEVARQTDRLRRRLAGVIVLILAGMALMIGWLFWSAYQTRQEVIRDRDRLLARVDSVDAVLQSAAQGAASLKQALDSARREAEALRRSITQRGTSEAAIESLDSEVGSTIQRHDPLLRAAHFDAGSITANNSRGVVMVFVDKGEEGRVGATGFVIRTSADTGWIVTSRHILETTTGLDPERIAVVFQGGKQAWRGRVVARHASADVALLRVQAWGHVFPVQQVNPDAASRAGEPVVILGFPHGLDLQEGDWRQQGLRSSTTTGTMSAVSPERLQIDGYGAPGASGSPIFSSAGEVIGVLSGGAPESGGRMIYAVPTSALKMWVKQ